MGVGTYALVDMADTVGHLGLDETQMDKRDSLFLSKLINAVSEKIESYCGRNIKSRSYTEYRDGDGGYHLALEQYPVTKIARLTIGRRVIGSIVNQSQDATFSSISVQDDKLTLSVTGGADDGDTELELITGYPTLSLLQAQVNTVGSWSMILLPSVGGFLSRHLLDCSGISCLNILAHLAYPAVPRADFELVEGGQSGILYCPTGFLRGHNNILIEYTAGYVIVPEDIQLVCFQMISEEWKMASRDPGLKSEKLGDYSYQVFDLTAKEARLLSSLSQYLSHSV